MTKLSKRLKAIESKVDRNKFYALEDALNLVKECATAKFDESIANFSFTNAEGKKVYEIIKPSYVLSRSELYKKDSYWESVEKGEGLTDVEKKNTYFLRDNYLVTKHKELLKNLKINILKIIFQ